MMDEGPYLRLCDATFRRIVDAFEDVDSDLAEVDVAGDVVTLTFRGDKRCIINTQRPVRQLWLAGGTRAWHFSWDTEKSKWLDDKGTGDELFGVIAKLAREIGGVSLRV